MIPVSTRYLTPLVVLLALTAIPVGVHGVGTLKSDDCRDPQAFQATQGIPGSEPDLAATPWVSRSLVQWSVGSIWIGPDHRRELRYRIFRTYDSSDLYNYPLKFLGRPFDPDRTDFSWRETNGERIPVYVASLQRRGAVQLAIYMFVAGADAVSSPLRMELGSALPKLLGGARPSTLMMVSGSAPRKQRQEIEQAAVDWLASALAYYREVCLP